MVEFHYKQEITECSLKISDSYVTKNPKNYKPEIVSDVLREYLAKLTRFFGGPNAKPLCSQLYSKKLLSATVYQMVLESPMYINQALLESAGLITGNARLDDFLGILEEDAFAPIAEEIRNGEEGVNVYNYYSSSLLGMNTQFTAESNLTACMLISNKLIYRPLK